MNINTIIEQINKALENIGENNSLVVAIDGMAASGKTSLADKLAAHYDASVIHMDDFFLPALLRTKERLEEVGGNVHYERFQKQVLPFIKNRKNFCYDVFDCSIMDYNGHRDIKSSALRIVEGSYSHHPIFGDYADIKIFRKIESDEQMKRIIKRNGEDMALRFKNEWIPLEEKYFEKLDLRGDNIIVIQE